MANGEKMAKFDMGKEFANLRQSEQHFIRKLESMNMERAKEMRALKNRNKWTGLLLACGVFAIYGYSMYAVKQERFLDDFDKMPDEQSKS